MKGCGVLCLTQPCKEREFYFVSKNLRLFGFEVFKKYISEDIYLGNWCGNPKERLRSFNESWNSEFNKIFLIKGGSGTDHILPFIDFKKLKKKDKMYIGYSDITPLLNVIYQYTGNICLHGPMPSKKKLRKIDCEVLNKALKKEDYGIKFSKYYSGLSKVSGKSVGGNLSRLVEYTTKKIEWNFDKKILFLEDTKDISGYRFVNLLLAFKENNKVNPSAIVLGHIKRSEIGYIMKSLKVLFPKVPLVSNVAFGHGSPNLTIPIGADCEINFKKKKIKFIFPKK